MIDLFIGFCISDSNFVICLVPHSLERISGSPASVSSDEDLLGSEEELSGFPSIFGDLSSSCVIVCCVCFFLARSQVVSSHGIYRKQSLEETAKQWDNII